MVEGSQKGSSPSFIRPQGGKSEEIKGSDGGGEVLGQDHPVWSWEGPSGLETWVSSGAGL